MSAGSGCRSPVVGNGGLAFRTWWIEWFNRQCSKSWSRSSNRRLAIVTPVVAGYLIYDWNRMLAAIDNWTPPARRPTARALASDAARGTARGGMPGAPTLRVGAILCEPA